MENEMNQTHSSLSRSLAVLDKRCSAVLYFPRVSSTLITVETSVECNLLIGFEPFSLDFSSAPSHVYFSTGEFIL